MNSNLQVILEGVGVRTLRTNDHIATGGEGTTYRVQDRVVKLYTDPKHMTRADVRGKIQLLSTIANPSIVAPQGVVTTTSGNPIGFYMPYVEGTALPKVFTTAFWQREAFTLAHAVALTTRMYEVVQTAHNAHALMVDANEMNWIVGAKKKGYLPYVIDVDSWAIGGWNATAIMPSVRDWHTKEFSLLTDWFVWGIVTFQIFTGIHPYKGTLAGFARGDFEARMKANASVFASGVRLPNVVRDFAQIPSPLLAWYKATFQNGERTEPPSPEEKGMPRTVVGAVTVRVVQTGRQTLVYEKLYDRARVVKVFPCGVLLTEQGAVVEVENARTLTKGWGMDTEVVRVEAGWLVVGNQAGTQTCVHVHGVSMAETELALPFVQTQWVRYDNRLFGVTERGLTELQLHLFGKPLLSVGQTWGVVSGATRWFEGVGVEDALGAMHVVVPQGDKACIHLRVPELDGLAVVSASAGERFMVLVGLDKKGQYHKLELTLAKDYSTYRVWHGLTDTADLSVAILPKGVVAGITEDGTLNLFVPSNGALNKVQDAQIRTGLVLGRIENKVVLIRKGVLWSVRMQ